MPGYSHVFSTSVGFHLPPSSHQKQALSMPRGVVPHLSTHVTNAELPWLVLHYNTLFSKPVFGMCVVRARWRLRVEFGRIPLRSQQTHGARSIIRSTTPSPSTEPHIPVVAPCGRSLRREPRGGRPQKRVRKAAPIPVPTDPILWWPLGFPRS